MGLSRKLNYFNISGTYILKGHASLPKSPLIGGLFTCPKNPSAPSVLSRRPLASDALLFKGQR